MKATSSIGAGSPIASPAFSDRFGGDTAATSPAQQDVQTTPVLLGIFDRVINNRPDNLYCSFAIESSAVGSVIEDFIKTKE